MPRKVIVISALVFGLVVLVDVFFEQEQSATVLNVLATTATDSMIDDKYVVHVDCSYSNPGRESSFVVWAQLIGTDKWEKSDETTLEHNEQKRVRFSFTEVTPPDTSQMTYSYFCGHGYEPECLLVALCPQPTPGRFLSDRSS